MRNKTRKKKKGESEKWMLLAHSDRREREREREKKKKALKCIVKLATERGGKGNTAAICKKHKRKTPFEKLQH